MNGGQIFALCVVIVIFGFGFARHYMRHQERMPRDDPEYRTRIEALEQRVKTLERIVTDKGYDLKREFDKL